MGNHIDLNAKDTARDHRKIAAIIRVALSDRIAVIITAITVDGRIIHIVPVIAAALMAELGVISGSGGRTVSIRTSPKYVLLTLPVPSQIYKSSNPQSVLREEK